MMLTDTWVNLFLLCLPLWTIFCSLVGLLWSVATWLNDGSYSSQHCLTHFLSGQEKIEFTAPREEKPMDPDLGLVISWGQGRLRMVSIKWDEISLNWFTLRMGVT